LTDELRIPVFGPQYKKIIMTRFTRTLATLLANGVPIVTSFDIVKSISIIAYLEESPR
jgi:type IV pilus assembly protein PilC